MTLPKPLEMTDSEIAFNNVKEAVSEIEKIAWEIPPINSYTPRLMQACIYIRQQEVAILKERDNG